MVRSRYMKQRSTYQLILMDYKMPLCDGCESTTLIRNYLNEYAPDLRQPLIACTTSFSGKDFKNKALRSGMDLFYTKPIFKRTLQSIMKRVRLAPN